MAFKGTTTRNALQLAEEIENVGGHINAYTSRENTAYYAKVLKEDVGLVVDVISDILQNSVIDNEELERERSVILQEIYQANDTPDDIVFDHFQLTAYPDQAMGRPVLGEADIVKSLSRDTVLSYMQDNYATSRMVFSASGNVDHDTLVAMVEEKFTSLPRETQILPEPTRYVGGILWKTAPIWNRFIWLPGLMRLNTMIPIFTACRSCRPCSVVACHHGCFRKSAKNEGLSIRFIALFLLMMMVGCWGFMPVRAVMK